MLTIKDSKKLFFCLALITVTACGGGGGGGGGGSSAPPEVNIPPAPEINIPDILNPNSGYILPKPEHIDKHGNVNISKIGDNGNLKGEKAVGIFSENKTVTLKGDILITDEISKDGRGEQNLDGYSFGAFLQGGEFVNSGKIFLQGDKVAGILGNNSDITNNNIIKSINGNKTNNIIGIFSSGKNGIVRNNGEINLSSTQSSIGMYLYNSAGINNTNIIVSSEGTAVGIYAIGKNASGTNNGKIIVKGNGYGMVSGYGGKVTNLGEITVQNKGYGMYAFAGGYALNDKGGVINLSSQANGAMLADGNGSIVENRGVINIDKNNSIIKNGEELKAINGGTFINKGIINRNGKLVVDALGGNYIVGTSKSGDYGKLLGKDIVFKGNIKIDSEITEREYKDSYFLKGIAEGENIETDEVSSVNSTSLLYSAEIIEKENGTADGVLIRNDKEISDFAEGKLKNTAELFNGYYNEEKYSSLAEETKNLIDIIDVSSVENLGKSLQDLTPSIYGNIGRQVFETVESFRKAERDLLFTKYGDGFVLLNNNSEVSSGKNITGYESTMTGFLGRKTFGKEKNIFGTFGYAFSDIDYNSGEGGGEAHSIYFSLNRNYKNEKFLFETGIGFGYNFHETERNISGGTKTDSDFNSYSGDIFGRVSKEYDSFVELKPFWELGLIYCDFESFDEKVKGNTVNIKSQDFISAKSKIGLEINKKYDSFKFYARGDYSYEFGNTDKKVSYTYNNISNFGTALKDEEENGLVSFEAGITYTLNNMSFGVNSRKEFGKRDSTYFGLNISYLF